MLQFVDYAIEGEPKYSIEECKERDQTYYVPLKVRVRLINKEKNEVKEQKVYMADLHKMTDTGTFIVNGAERVIVSQLVRSPGAYYTLTRDKLGKKLYSAQVIPNRGAWLEYESDSNDIMYVKIDRTRKLPITALLRAFGPVSYTHLVEHVEAKLMDTTAFVVSKPINRQFLTQNIKFVLHSKEKMQRLKEQNEKLQKKMDDIKIIYRAKLCLMGYLNMTEEQAHRYIQKQAMEDVYKRQHHGLVNVLWQTLAHYRNIKHF